MHLASHEPIRRELEKQLRATLVRNGGNVKAAATELGLAYRTVQRWISDWGLRPVVRKSRGGAGQPTRKTAAA